MNGSLKDQAVLVIGRGSGIARAVTLAARDAGATVIAAGRDQQKLSGRDAGGGDHQRRRRTLVRSLALELGPIRVNAISPGTIDTGAWDALGPQGKADFFAAASARNPVMRIGTTDDIANAVLFALTSSFLTGQTLHIDGGEPLT